nr:HNH endonuclease signature motif containing protein [uncultured Roseateles sp.]
MTKNDDPSLRRVAIRDRSADRSGHQFRYGSRRTWEIVFDAVRVLGHPASATEIGNRILSEIPDFARKNVLPDLSMLSVNCRSRGNHAANRKPRRTDAGNTYDRLIRVGHGRDVRFALYDPRVHGVWMLVGVGEKVLRPRFLGVAAEAERETARADAMTQGLFDPSEDARRRIMSAIVQREGQPAFRQTLLHAYGGACAISGCAVEALLEAAHIVPYRGPHTNVAQNGLLLRADLHKLFDLHLLSIDPVTRVVRLSEELKGSEYACLDGIALRRTSEPAMAPASEALRHHEERCGWLNARCME